MAGVMRSPTLSILHIRALCIQSIRTHDSVRIGQNPCQSSGKALPYRTWWPLQSCITSRRRRDGRRTGAGDA
jgi:hypothetical protein